MAVLLSAVLWGTLWIPIRQIHAPGASGAAATTVGFLIPLVVLLPIAAGKRRLTFSGLARLAPSGFWLALGIALYTEGIVRGQIARVILLFYLTPVWSTLLARIVLDAPITGRRLTTIALGLAGMLVIFGSGGAIPIPRATAEWMGLAAGFAWAVGLVCTNRDPTHWSLDRALAHFIFLGPIFLFVTGIPAGGTDLDVEFRIAAISLPWVLAFALAWMLPVVWLTVFAASRVDPGRFGVLLMLEIVVGLTTATLLTEEPFGAREWIGSLLVMGAIGAEIHAPLGPMA